MLPYRNATPLLCRDQGTGINCVKTADADGGPKCPSSQIALCCDTLATSQNCNAASGTACKDLYRQPRDSIQPFCCDEMDMLGCVNIESPEHKDVSCTVIVSSLFPIRRLQNT